MIHKEEFRANDETLLRMKKSEKGSPLYSAQATFGAVLGIPIVASDDVPNGKMQFWRDGEMVREVEI